MTMQTMREVAQALQLKVSAEPRPASQVSYRPPYTGPCSEHCPICGGHGFVRLDVPLHDPRFGRLEPCPNMPVENRHFEWRNGLYLDEESQLSWEVVRDFPLDALTANFTPLQPCSAKRAAEWLQRYVGRGHGLAYLYGPYGVAKSLFIKIAVAEALRAGREAIYARMSEILDNLRSAFDERDPSEAAIQRMNRWVEVPILAIDEFEKFNPTDWVAERLFQLVDRRYSDALRRQSLTLIASNVPPEQVDAAIASRVHDGRCLYVEMLGRDARPAMTDGDLF